MNPKKSLKEQVVEFLTAFFVLSLAAACIIALLFPGVLALFYDWRFILLYLVYPFLLGGVVQALATPLVPNDRKKENV